MVVFKPHMVTVTNVDGGSSTLQVQITPKSCQAVFSDFGVELKRPHQLLTDAPERSKFQEGGRVVWEGRTYAIVRIRSFSGISVADHVEVLMDEIVTEAGDHVGR